MHFDTWQAFWQMGGYALYVWLSFGVTMMVMVGITIASVREHRQLLHKVVKEQARRARIRKAHEIAHSSQAE